MGTPGHHRCGASGLARVAASVVPTGDDLWMPSARDLQDSGLWWAAEEPGLSTSFPDLDDITGGLSPGGLWLVCGSPGAGRTALLSQLAAHLGISGHAITLLTARERPLDLFAQMTRQLSPPPRRLGWAGLGESSYRVARSIAAERLASTGLWITAARDWADAPTTDKPDDKVGLVARIGQDRPSDVLFIDDLDWALGLHEVDRRKVLNDALRSLSSWAQAEAFVVVVSLPEEVVLKGGRVRDGMRRESEVVVRLTRPDQFLVGIEATAEPRLGEADFEVLSNRRGPTGVMTVAWQPHRRRFTDFMS